jgi:hypothetical protein
MARSPNSVAIAALILAGLGGCSGENQEFIVCESTYAVCTTAQCQPVAGKDEEVACDCDVETGYSAGLKPCDGQVKAPRERRSSRAITRSKAMRDATTVDPGLGASTCRA